MNNPYAPINGEHAGLKLYRDVILKYKPLLHVCGHIHEAQGKAKIGKTIVVNAGYGGEEHFALIDIDKKINVKFF